MNFKCWGWCSSERVAVIITTRVCSLLRLTIWLCGDLRISDFVVSWMAVQSHLDFQVTPRVDHAHARWTRWTAGRWKGWFPKWPRSRSGWYQKSHNPWSSLGQDSTRAANECWMRQSFVTLTISLPCSDILRFVWSGSTQVVLIYVAWTCSDVVVLVNFVTWCRWLQGRSFRFPEPWLR